MAFVLRAGNSDGIYEVEWTLLEAFTYNEDVGEGATSDDSAQPPGGSQSGLDASTSQQDLALTIQRFMDSIIPASLGGVAAPKAPTVVWVEDFENAPAPNYNSTAPNNQGSSTGTDTGQLRNYRGVAPNNQYPTIGDNWWNISYCNGIRLSGNKTVPARTGTAIAFTTGTGYCEQIPRQWVLVPAGWNDSNRESWWNAMRVFGRAIGVNAMGLEASAANNNFIAGYVTHDKNATSNIVYETKGMDLGGNWPAQTEQRYVTARLDAAAVCAAQNQPSLGVEISNVEGTDFFASAPVNPCTGPQYIPSGISPLPSGEIYRAQRFLAPSNTLLSKTAMSSAKVQVWNKTWLAAGNDFAFDNITLLDVTPTLHKEYVAPSEQVYGDNDENKLVRVYGSSPKSAHLVFTVTNTTDYQEKAGWGFTESLPAGLNVDSSNDVTFNGCGTNPTVTPSNPTSGNSTITVSGGKLSGGAANATCTISVPVIATGFDRYDTPGTLTGNAGTSAMKGVSDPNAVSIEFWQSTL